MCFKLVLHLCTYETRVVRVYGAVTPTVSVVRVPILDIHASTTLQTGACRPDPVGSCLLGPQAYISYMRKVDTVPVYECGNTTPVRPFVANRLAPCLRSCSAC